MTSCSTIRDVGHGVGHAPAALAGNGEDRIADQLSGAVVGDVAAPVGPHQLGPDRRRVDEDVGHVGPGAERVDVGVLEQQEPVVGTALEQGVLQVERLPVGHRAEPAHPQGARRGGDRRRPGGLHG